jgi:uncharacterized protein YbbK (DUF523 family)
MVDISKLEQQQPDKPVIAISRCLLGEPVRYDGQARPVSWIIDILSQHCEFLPVCPELEAGFGVPRPPIRLLQKGDNLRVVSVEDPGDDKTEKLELASKAVLAEIQAADGLILKARSPSCGVGDTPVFDEAGVESSVGAGVFTRMCLMTHPGFPVIDEQGLASEAGRLRFLIQVFRYCCRRHS